MVQAFHFDVPRPWQVAGSPRSLLAFPWWVDGQRDLVRIAPDHACQSAIATEHGTHSEETQLGGALAIDLHQNITALKTRLKTWTSRFHGRYLDQPRSFPQLDTGGVPAVRMVETNRLAKISLAPWEIEGRREAGPDPQAEGVRPRPARFAEGGARTVKVPMARALV